MQESTAPNGQRTMTRTAHAPARELSTFKPTHVGLGIARSAYASSNCVNIGLGRHDGHRVESDGRLGEDAAVERGAGFEGGEGLDQKDALEV